MWGELLQLGELSPEQLAAAKVLELALEEILSLHFCSPLPACGTVDVKLLREVRSRNRSSNTNCCRSCCRRNGSRNSNRNRGESDSRHCRNRSEALFYRKHCVPLLWLRLVPL